MVTMKDSPGTHARSRHRQRIMRPAAFFVLVVLFSGVEATIGFCNDKDTSCSSWALDGECDGTNGEHVKTLCPQSCGVCTTICSDRNETCASWAKAGECASSAALCKGLAG